MIRCDKARKKVAILWGSGLGDLLAIKPFVEAINEYTQLIPLLVTTRRTYLEAAFREIAFEAQLLLLSGRAFEGVTRCILEPDVQYVYLGPHNSVKTRLLSHFFYKARPLASRSDKVFLPVAISEDAFLLGFSSEVPRPYGKRPLFRHRPSCASKIKTSRPYVVIHATPKKDSSKSWGHDNWIGLIEWLRSEGFGVLLVGARADGARLRTIAHGVGHEGIGIVAGASFSQVETLIAGATLVVCHNSGIMHVALAYERPTVVLSGSAHNAWRPPFPFVENVDGDCEQRCNQYICPRNEAYPSCISNVSLDETVEACKLVLRRSKVLG